MANIQYRKNINIDSWETALEQGVIMLHGGLDEDSCNKKIEDLMYLAIKRISPIRFYIMSDGGSVFNGLALFDQIRFMTDSGLEVYTIAQGVIASLGSVIFQAGSKRIMGRHAWLMIHELSSLGQEGTTSKIQDDAELCERLQNETLFYILAEKSELSVDEIKEKCLRRDWWLSSLEAKELGFCDEIY